MGPDRGRSTIDGGRAGGREQWTVLSGTGTIGHGLHVADRAQGLTGTLLHDVMVGE